MGISRVRPSSTESGISSTTRSGPLSFMVFAVIGPSAVISISTPSLLRATDTLLMWLVPVLFAGVAGATVLGAATFLVSAGAGTGAGAAVVLLVIFTSTPFSMSVTLALVPDARLSSTRATSLPLA